MDKMNVFPAEESNNLEIYHSRWAMGDLSKKIADTPDAPDEAMIYLCQERPNVPVLMLQGLVNVMLKYNLYNKEVLVDLAYALHVEYTKWGSDSSNNIFYCNVVKPLQDMLTCSNFSWKAAFTFIDANLYLDDIKDYFQLDAKAFQLALSDVKNGVPLQDLEYYAICSSPDFVTDECKMFPTAMYYAIFKKIVDIKSHKELVKKYAYKIPVEALIPLAILEELGAPVTKIDVYSDSFTSNKFWKERLSLQSVTDASKEMLGLSFVKNFFAIYQLIFGEFLEMYGEEPMIAFSWSLLKDGIKKAHFVTRKEPFTYEHKLYFNSGDEFFCCTEGNLPYIWGTITSKLTAALNHQILDAKIDFRPVNGQRATTLNVIQFSQKSYRKPQDHYLPFMLEQIYVNMTLKDFTDTCNRYLVFAKQIHCYDYYLLAVVDVFYRENLNYAKWIKAYLLNPLAFSTGLINAVVAYMSGAVDYHDFFECTEPGWYQSYLELANGFSTIYNFSAACFTVMQLKTGLYVREFINVSLDYNFPDKIILRSNTGETRVIEFHNMITNDKYYHKLYLSMLHRAPVCYRDANGDVIVAESR